MAFSKGEIPMDSIGQQSYTPEIINKSTLIKDGNPALYRLNNLKVSLDQPELYRKITLGERTKNKPHKIILLVGETGTGKTTLINVMVNYMLGVKREDRVWFEITDDQSDLSSAHSQTSIITVYGVYLQEIPMDLTIIDTPGYGDTRGVELDKKIAESFFSLSKSEDGINKIDAVCLVIMAHQNRLSDRQIYIFDAVQSLFGRDITENIVLLFTHSNGAPPRNALTAVKEAQIQCAVNEQNQPVFFLFNNCQSDAHDEEYEMIQEQSWTLSFRGIKKMFEYFDTIKPESLMMTLAVLRKRKQFEAKIRNLNSRVNLMEQKQDELKQTREALEKNWDRVRNDEGFKFEVEVSYKEKVDIDRSLASMATCCTVCEENCHYPGCWWVSNLSWCSAMRNYHCTVCTNKCSYKEHVKGAKIYVTKTKKEKRTYEDLKKTYKSRDGESLVQSLKEELQKSDNEKRKLLKEAFECVEALESIALNTNSVLTLQHIDFLIEKLKEINEPEMVKKLENIKKRAGEGKLRATMFSTNRNNDTAGQPLLK